MTALPGPGFDAVVLAGGRARRVGGVDKPGLLVGERTLLASVSQAAAGAGARRVILVGPDRPWLPGTRGWSPEVSHAGAPPGTGVAGPGLPGVSSQPPDGWRIVREDPPGSGPVPALRCGLAEATAAVVAVLAADLPLLRAHHLRPLLAAVAGGRAGAVMLDDSGRQQWLVGCWRTAGLRTAASRYAGQSLRGLLAPLAPAMISYDLAPEEPPPWLDCDTPDDLARARRWWDREHAREGEAGR